MSRWYDHSRMNEIDLAWAAGFLDGEGCFYAGTTSDSKGNVRYQCSIGAVQMVEPPIVKLESMFGGHVSNTRLADGVCKRLWRVAGSKRCLNVSTMLLPYLTGKREQAEMMIELCETFDRERYAWAGIPKRIVEKRLELIDAIASAKDCTNR